MIDDQKRQSAQAIVRVAQNMAQTLTQYNELIGKISVNYKESLIQQLITVVENNDVRWRSQIESAEKEILACPELIDKIVDIQTQFQNEEYVVSLAPQYLQLVNSEINSEGNIKDLQKWIPQVSQNIDNIFSDSFDFNIKRNVLQLVQNILNHSNGFAIRFLQRLAQLDTFEYFQNIEHSVVIVGANGSGKSSFSRNTKKVLGGNVAIISAQKVFSLEEFHNIPLSSQSLNNVHSYQANDKLGRGREGHGMYLQDFQNLMISLVSDHINIAETFYTNSKESTVERKSSILEQTMSIWKEIITHRFMTYEKPFIKINTYSGGKYDFPDLSDGEKAVFYYIAHILIAKENSFIIVDEPENHLHMVVVSKLWDKLEQVRSDCRFIYLTHNLDFASSRIQATKFWNKSFTPPAKWDVVPLPHDEELPEALLMELLGSRKKILFCEGEKSSSDFKLYTLLFPEFTIKPVSGHLNVITFTRAFNKSKDIFGNSAIGIIDGDYHSKAAKEKWASDSIYCIEVQEVENILCDSDILEAAKKRYHCSDEQFEKAKKSLFSELEKNKEEQAVKFATHKINNALKSNLIEESKTKNDLNRQFSSSIRSLDVEAFVTERIQLFERIISESDFDSGVKFFNSKFLPGLIGDKIIRGYKDKILLLLEEQSDLLEILRTKYFSKVPVIQGEVAE
jgi:ABC-type Mn2+/Zn2+ transport system ATPase subunit